MRWTVSILMTLLLSLPCLAQYGRARLPDGSVPSAKKAPATVAPEEITIRDTVGSQVSIDKIFFKDEHGQRVALSSYFGEKPVLLTLIYFGCPSLCGPLFAGTLGAVRRISLTAGQDFEHVIVSIDPKEGPELALDKKESYLKDYVRAGASEGVHFLTGEEKDIQMLAKEVGYGYKFVPETGEYAHSAGIFILNPEGKVSRILYGIEFDSKDLKLSIMEAKQGKFRSVIEKFLLYCYRYDPNQKTYAVYAMGLVRMGGLLTLLIMGLYLFLFWRKNIFVKAGG